MFHGPEKAIILVLDSCEVHGNISDNIRKAKRIIGKATPFTYTPVVRCSGLVEATDNWKAVERCSVWTNFLLEDRGLIIATEHGLVQLGITDEVKPGILYKDARLGTILLINPLVTMDDDEENETMIKVQRALKSLRVKETA